MIKKWYDFILESESVAEDDTQTQNTEKEQSGESSETDIPNEVKDVVKEMIEKTVENKGGEFKSFIDKYIESTEDVKIEGLINDSDIFDFYLKYRQYIDPILNNINFFNKNPRDLNKLGLYDFSVEGTKVAIDEIVRSLK
jgi:hypothetical protein